MPNANHPRNQRPITVLHTADWQLGKPFASVTDPMKRARVQLERFEAIRRTTAIARDRQASFVIVAGDLFDSPTPTHETISAALGAIAEIGVPVFAIPGNHDHGGPDSLWEQEFFVREKSRLAPSFHLLDARTPTNVALRDGGDGPRNVILLPCPLLRRHEPDDPTAWIRDLDFSAFGDAPRIVIAHGSTMSFGAAAGHHHGDDDDQGGPTGTNTIAIDRLPLDEIDYIALGDFHGPMAAGPKAAYSGTPEIDRFPKEGQEPGHVACVTVARGAVPTVAAVRTGRFRWLTREVNLDATGSDAADAYGPAYLDDVLTQATEPQSPGEPGFDGCLADVRLTGTVSLAGRVELDRVIESWQARLLRLDLADDVQIAPTPDEIHDLTARPDDPIIARIATELVRRLEAGEAGGDLEVVRQALHILHGLAHTTNTTSTGAANA
jgi:DNA repair exonuclease SbcCD nuclease subunit